MSNSREEKRKAQVSVSIDIDMLEAINEEAKRIHKPFSALLNEKLRETVKKKGDKSEQSD